MVYTKDEINILGLGALMHDIGMAMVPKEILDKPGPLTEEEAEIIKKHVGWGTEMVFKSGGIDKMAMQFIEQHHERYDGSGYPYGLEGDSISTAGTIGAIIDVYDAITSDRGYAKGLSAEDALKKIYEWSNQDFKKELVEEFIRCMGIFPIGSLVELSTGSIGVVVTINRYRRLKPRIALVLNPDKQPYKRKMIVTLLDFGSGKDEVKIKRVLPANTYGIDPMAHIVQL
jgi:HD-GYP domain-containing protein (c-di-GMP phosphodiesterase class II)